MERRREKLLKRVLDRPNGRNADKSKTDPRKEAPRVTFWSLPREIRDQIYVELLYNPVKPLIIGFDKLQLARKGVWQPVRPSIRGFYRPVIHMHRANPRWEHQSELHDEMAIFEVAEEARSTFLRSHVLLEVTSSHTAAVSKWEQKLGDAAVETLQKLHIKSSIDVTVTGTFGPKLAEYQRIVIDKLHYSDPSFEGPALCVEIREEGQEVVLLSRPRFPREGEGRLARLMKSTVMYQALSIHKKGRFSGSQAISIAKAIGAEGLIERLTLPAADIIAVSEYDDYPRTGYRVHLRDEYLHVIAIVPLSDVLSQV